MSIRQAVMQAGIAAQAAAAILGITTACSAVTSTGAPAGSNQAGATLVPSDEIILTGTSVGSGTGYKLPSGVDASGGNGLCNLGDTISVFNQGGNTVLVYPNTATGKVQGGGAGAGFSVANNKSATFVYMGSDLWAATLSA